MIEKGIINGEGEEEIEPRDYGKRLTIDVTDGEEFDENIIWWSGEIDNFTEIFFFGGVLEYFVSDNVGGYFFVKKEMLEDVMILFTSERELESIFLI